MVRNGYSSGAVRDSGLKFGKLLGWLGSFVVLCDFMNFHEYQSSVRIIMLT